MGARGLLHTNAITDISPLAGLTKLRDLNIHTLEVSDLSALSGLTQLTELRLAGNLFTDLSALRGLTSLTDLELTGNSITDLSALSGLTRLTNIDLRYNPDLSDIQPLLDNPGLGAGDIVELRFTSVTCTDQALLAAKGVEVLQSQQPVVLDFWAEWCAPCRAISPIIKQLAEDYDGKLKVVKMNIDENPKTPGKYGVRAIPMVLAFQNGEVVEQLQGARPKAAFEQMVQKLI